MRKACAFFFLLCGFLASAATESLVQLEPLDVELTNTDAIKRGAEFFVTHCHVCHTVKYAVDDPISQDAGITKREPLKIDGNEVPDLSLKALERGPSKVYTYLQAYYVDDNDPRGYGNLVKSNTSMPNVLLSLQGEHRLLEQELNDATSLPRLYEVLYKVKPGTVSPEEYFKNINDLMHYLVYISDPSEVERLAIGPWVLGYLAILFVLLFLIYLRMKRRYK